MRILLGVDFLCKLLMRMIISTWSGFLPMNVLMSPFSAYLHKIDHRILSTTMVPTNICNYPPILCYKAAITYVENSDIRLRNPLRKAELHAPNAKLPI